MGETPEFEYVAVSLETSVYAKDADRKHTEILNRVARHGWRLISVTGTQGGTMAYFERPKATR